MGPTWWWDVARASGLVAWALAVMSVTWGLCAVAQRRHGGRQARRTRPWLWQMHRAAAGLAVATAGLHVLSLVLDPWLRLPVWAAVVPMSAPWKAIGTTWGVLAGWIVVGAWATSRWRGRVPQWAWRTVHLSTLTLLVLVPAHALLTGSDASSAGVRLAILGTSAAGGAAIAWRWGAVAGLGERNQRGTGGVSAVLVQEGADDPQVHRADDVLLTVSSREQRTAGQSHG